MSSPANHGNGTSDAARTLLPLSVEEAPARRRYSSASARASHDRSLFWLSDESSSNSKGDVLWDDRSCQGLLRQHLSGLFIEMLMFAVVLVPCFVISVLRLAISEPRLFNKEFASMTFWGRVLELLAWLHITYLVLRASFRLDLAFNMAVLIPLLCSRVAVVFRRSILENGVGFQVVPWLHVWACSMYALRFVVIARGFLTFSRRMVSGRKRRYVDAARGIDLDLAYITRRIVAMGFPSDQILEQSLRNPMEQVQLLLNTRHSGYYKVYNLCSERSYSPSFEREFHEVQFPDHNPCNLADIGVICQDMDTFWRMNPKRNVVVVHCKAGKGRTGLVISSFLLHTRQCKTADEALAFFAKKRTYDGRGVTIPSQIRYVHHYGSILKENGLRTPRWVRLASFEVGKSARRNSEGSLVSWRLQLATSEGTLFDSRATRWYGDRPPCLEGDIKVVFFSGKFKIFQAWLHTSYDLVRTRKGATARHHGGEEPFGDADVIQLWSDPEAFTADGEGKTLSGFEVVLAKDQLDGLHKRKDVWSKVLTHVRLTFAELPDERYAELAAERRRQQRQTSVCSMSQTSHVPSMFDIFDVEDYDDLEHDTDHEDLLRFVHRGHLLRRPGGCSRPRRCFCELDVTGRLHLSGSSALGTIVVDLVRNHGCNIQCCTSGRGRPSSGVSAWRIRNPRSQRWEVLETIPNDAWDQAFADVIRYGLEAADKHSVFTGFFWKLNSHRASKDGEAQFPSKFDPQEWRVRLVVLKADGRMEIFSHKNRAVEVYCRIGEPGNRIEPLNVRWPGMIHIVLFHVYAGADCQPRAMAALAEDFEAFVEHECSILRRRQRASKAVHEAGSF